MNIIIPRALIFYCYKMNIYNLYYVCLFHCFGGHLARLTRMVCLNANTWNFGLNFSELYSANLKYFLKSFYKLILTIFSVFWVKHDIL